MLRLRIGLTDDDASTGEVALEPVTNQVTTSVRRVCQAALESFLLLL